MSAQTSDQNKAVQPDTLDDDNEEEEEDIDEEDDEEEEECEDFEEEEINKEDTSVKSELNVRKTLFIKNLPMSTTEADIRALSSDILEVRIDISHLKNEKNPKYAILDFASGDLADRTLKSLKGQQINGVDIIADFIGGKSARANVPPAVSISSDLLKLYVTGFGKEISMEQLKEMFPTASDITLPLNVDDGNRPVGYAFIHYTDETMCKAAHDSMQDYVYHSRTLVVMYGKKSTPESQRALGELKRRFPMPKRGRPKKIRAEPKRPAYESDDDDEDDDDEEDDDEDDDDV